MVRLRQSYGGTGEAEPNRAGQLRQIGAQGTNLDLFERAVLPNFVAKVSPFPNPDGITTTKPMRHIAIIALIGLASSGHGATLQIPTENRVIIPGHWRPSGGYMDVALRCAAWFLEHPDVSDTNSLRQVALIRQHAGEYRVQFIGTFRNGHTVLLCNFFPAPKSGEKQDPYSYWRTRRVEAQGGGYWFWRLEFDNAVGRCTNFAVNGDK